MQLRFRLNKAETQIGDHVFITGSIPQLGAWNCDKAIQLKTNKTKYPMWEQQNEISFADSELKCEYKYIIKGQDKQIEWEQGDNRKLIIKNASGPVVVADKAFNSFSDQEIILLDSQSMENNHHSNDKQSDDRQLQQETVQVLSKSKITQVKDSSNELINELVKLDNEKRTWKEKLEVVYDLVQKHKEDEGFATKGLSVLAAYVYFINSHQIKCSEDGTHFRPNHHANTSYDLYLTLDRELTTDSNSFIIQMIIKNLPSFAEKFTCSVPLTRIRDIAHRNDIPQELKQEIKHRLQNKLHRNADPGDLKTCEELIHRIRKGDYNQDFKYQFEIFYEELKEFFNAVGLDKLLSQIKELSQKQDLKNKINEFLQLKQQNKIQDLSIFTQLRQLLKEQLSEILIDQSQKQLYQQIKLAEIDIESFLFVKLSEKINHLQIKDSDSLRGMLTLAHTTIDNMLLSNLYQEELEIIKNEIIMYGVKEQDLESSFKLLRLKSSLERGLRLANNFTSEIMMTFQDNVQELGQSFGIDQHSVNVFSESFVRSHIILQYDKSLEAAIIYIRKKLNLPPYITISSGKQSSVLGKVKLCQNLYESLSEENESLIILLENADGTEEIPSNVKAVLLKHDLPQLSHLAIRARQNGCIFVCCENNEVYQQNLKTVEKYEYVEFSILNESIKIKQVTSDQFKDQSKDKKKEQQKTVELKHQGIDELIKDIQNQEFKFEEVIIQSNKEKEVSLLGSKSVNSLILQEIANQDKNFSCPSQITIPMSIPLFLLSQNQESFNELKKLMTKLDQCEMKDINTIRNQIMQLLETIYHTENEQNLQELVKIIKKQLQLSQTDTLIAVRSSSTLEDLDKMAGAGLFDSYLNISIQDEQKIQKSIVKVWKSLYTERAVISRKQYGIKSEQAQMAVLVQSQVLADYSFIMHTQNPINKNQDQVYIEIALGLGETLASANQQGTPYRVIYDKQKRECEIISFASFSKGLFTSIEKQNSIEKCLDYSKVILTVDHQKLQEIGMKLGNIGEIIEQSYKKIPQDIEGAIVTDGEEIKIYVVQTRNQI